MNRDMYKSMWALETLKAQTVKNQLRAQGARVELLTAVAEATLQQQLAKSQNAKRQLQEALNAQEGHIFAVGIIKERLSELQAALGAITDDHSSHDPLLFINIQGNLAQLSERMEDSDDAIAATRSSEDHLIAAVEEAIERGVKAAKHSLATALQEYRSRSRSLSEASAANLQHHQELIMLCSRVRATVLTASQFHCNMCPGECSIEEVFIKSACGHYFCRKCATGWAEAQFDAGKIPNCTTEGCCQPYNQEDFKILDEALYQRFFTLNMHDDVRTNKYHKCAHCQVAMEADEDVDLSQGVCCPSCKTLSCLKCQIVWQEGHSCEEYQRQISAESAAEELAEYLRETNRGVHLRSAGGCGEAIEKAPDDCNSVWCSVCRFYFCWLCLKPIAQAGASDAERHQHFSETGPCFGKCFDVPAEEEVDLDSTQSDSEHSE